MTGRWIGGSLTRATGQVKLHYNLQFCMLFIVWYTILSILIWKKHCKDMPLQATQSEIKHFSINTSLT